MEPARCATKVARNGQGKAETSEGLLRCGSVCWFSNRTVELTNLALHHADGTKDSCKSRGAVLRICIKNDQCTNHMPSRCICAVPTVIVFVLNTCRVVDISAVQAHDFIALNLKVGWCVKIMRA